jgi:alpha-beta hydrolase superfamily lysophospholipase|tara:strand:+ start:4060 stop:4881 length:822 start_codon:yes stop_codon:yes gene_type:complete
MNFSDKYLQIDSKNKLYLRKWLPKKINKNIFIVHGLGEHSGRYEEFAKILTKKNIGVFCIDLIGHGKSSGKKGHIKLFEDYINAVENGIIYVRKKFLDTPIILFGHSLGGLVCLKFLIDRESKEIERSIISSPWIETSLKIPKHLLFIHKIFQKIIPRLQLSNNLITSHLSKNQKVVDDYENDILVHDKITLNLFSEIIKTIEDVLIRSSRIKVQTLIYHGKNDKIISNRGTNKIASLIPNNKFILFDNVYHEPHNDIEKDLVFKEITDFIIK